MFFSWGRENILLVTLLDDVAICNVSFCTRLFLESVVGFSCQWYRYFGVSLLARHLMWQSIPIKLGKSFGEAVFYYGNCGRKYVSWSCMKHLVKEAECIMSGLPASLSLSLFFSLFFSLFLHWRYTRQTVFKKRPQIATHTSKRGVKYQHSPYIIRASLLVYLFSIILQYRYQIRKESYHNDDRLLACILGICTLFIVKKYLFCSLPSSETQLLTYHTQGTIMKAIFESLTWFFFFMLMLF